MLRLIRSYEYREANMYSSNSVMLLPKVSVLVLTYNHASFIGKCLDSILAQNYDNFEIIIGDDSSSDATQEILLNYQTQYPDIIKLSLNKENIGITANCNKLLSLSTGEYVSLIGGDDVFLPNKISSQADFLSKNPEHLMSYHNAIVFYDDEEVVDYNYHDKVDPIFTMEALLRSIPFSVCVVTMMFRRSAALLAGFDKRIPVVSDRLFVLRLAASGKCGYIDEVLMKYRKRIDGASRSITYCERMQVFNIFEFQYPKYWYICFKAYGDIFHKRAQKDFDKKAYKKALFFAVRSVLRGVMIKDNICIISQSICKILRRILRL